MSQLESDVNHENLAPAAMSESPPQQSPAPIEMVCYLELLYKQHATNKFNCVNIVIIGQQLSRPLKQTLFSVHDYF